MRSRNNSIEPVDYRSEDCAFAGTFNEEYDMEYAIDDKAQDNGPLSVSGRVIGGAAAAGGFAGLVLIGPVVGVIVGAGAAIAATTNGSAGNAARKSGEVMASAGDRLKTIDKKHHVVQKTSKGISKGVKRVAKIFKSKE